MATLTDTFAEILPDAVPLTVDQIAKLPQYNVSKRVTNSDYLKQFQLLRKDNSRRLQIFSSRGGFFNVTHLCIHCKRCIHLSWKKTYYDSNKAEYHLRNFCNESGKASIQHKIFSREIKKEAEHQKLVRKTLEYSNYQGMMSNLEEADEGVSSGKIPKVVQSSTITKLSGISYKD